MTDMITDRMVEAGHAEFMKFGGHLVSQKVDHKEMFRRSFTAALAEAWRPISEAPKDQPCLIAWQEGCVWHIRRAYWDEKFEYNYDDDTEEDVYIGAWTDDSVASWGFQECNSFEPTHFAPLPAPPKVTP
ncbi:hypothetical protein [Acetobacter sp. DsW_063]|uniref:hypothetical protein n=1 Tax=Acetobacter sp. DsW_063 TaxID=1514894 RepID=UPI000A3D0912|nr:hypothetical protein [Acetobacter sp. DsW_063]OUJ16387.1 hypothetical protein HK28_00170 [Acetobacter sp. DsW_063]